MNLLPSKEKSGEPLGLNKGSIRAVIAIMITLAYIYLVIMFALGKCSQVPPTFSSVAMAVIFFYMGMRNSDKNGNGNGDSQK